MTRTLPTTILLSGVLLLAGSCTMPLARQEPATCAAAQFVVRQDFVGAHQGACTVTDYAAVTLQIGPEDPPPINDSAWFAFALEPREPAVAYVTLQYSGGQHRYRPKLSYDGRHWSALADSAVQVAPDRLSAQLTIELEERPVFIAGQELLTAEHSGRWLEQLARQAGLTPQQLGTSVAGAPIQWLDSQVEGRDVLLLVGRQHPPEVTGTIGLEAFAEALFADTALARRFRDHYAVVMVPLLNPDGIAGGHWRHNLGGVDLNRDWGPFTQPETRLMADLIDRLVADKRRIRVFLDFHATRRNLFYTQSDSDVTVPPELATRWLDAARPRLTDYSFTQEKVASSDRPTAKNYVYERFGIPAITCEMGDETDRPAIRRAAVVFAEELMALMLETTQTQWNQPVYDLLIRGGLVYDGSTRPPQRLDLGLRHGRIQTLHPAADALARRTIDASGLAVMPGFIDPHTHALADLRSAEHRANRNYQTQGVTTVFVGNDGGGVPDRAQVFAALEDQGIGTHMAFLAGHGNLREAVMGKAARAPDPQEMARMQSLLEGEMQAGAFGLSSGLFYAPGSYAQTAELVALARTTVAYGGLYDTHMRVESTQDDGLLAAVEETLEIARQSGIPAHIAHIKALGADSWGMSRQIIERIEAARRSGLEVTADQYPWQASGTRFSNALIPRRIMADSKQAMRQRLKDAATVAGLRPEMAANLRLRGGPDAMLVTGADSPWQGQTLAAIAGRLELDPLDAAIALVLEGDPPIASFVMQQDDIDAFAVQPWVMTGSDGSSGHPRKYATYPKAYREFVADRGLLSTAQWVHRSSGLVADTFGLCDRGYLKPGYVADIAVIDLQRFQPVADYRNATALTPGVQHLLLAGRAVIIDGEDSGELPGRVIRKNQQNCPPTAASVQ